MTKAQDQRPKSKREVAAIVLAADHSRPMARFKPLLAFGPTTVVKTAIQNVRSGGVETVVVVVGTGPRAEQLKSHLENSNVLLAINPDPDSEMSSSVACGLRAVPVETQGVIINPVDHAAVPGEIIAQLLNEWQQGALLVKPSWKQRGGHPVLIDLSFRDLLLDLDPQGGLKALFNQHLGQVRRIEVNSNLIARDMDTWDDYVALHQEVFGVPAPALPPGERV